MKERCPTFFQGSYSVIYTITRIYLIQFSVKYKFIVLNLFTYTRMVQHCGGRKLERHHKKSNTKA